MKRMSTSHALIATMIQNLMENIRILSQDLVEVLETPTEEVAEANKLRTLTEVVARINNLKDPTELRGGTNELKTRTELAQIIKEFKAPTELRGETNNLRTPMELAGKINVLETPTELIARISNLKPLLDALVDLWTSVSKSALPFLPESSVLVFLDVQKDALEIRLVLVSLQ